MNEKKRLEIEAMVIHYSDKRQLTLKIINKISEWMNVRVNEKGNEDE